MKQNTSHCDLTSFCRECSARADTGFGAKIFHRGFFCQITEKRTAFYHLTSFCCQCSALRAQSSFGAKKIRTTVQLQISEKNPHFIEETRRFFSQSDHDPQDSRLKIFPGLAFGGPPTFFCPRKFQSIPQRGRKPFFIQVSLLPAFSRDISETFIRSQTKFWKMSGVVYYYHTQMYL